MNHHAAHEIDYLPTHFRSAFPLNDGYIKMKPHPFPLVPLTLGQRQTCRSTSGERGSLFEASVTVSWSHFMTLWHWLSGTCKMAALRIQLIGFMLSTLGQFLISAATAIDMWSLQDRSLTVVTNVYTYSGLWNSCVGTAYGTTQCRPYFTILGLPGKRITFLHMLD